jgi:hypothetical protein
VPSLHDAPGQAGGLDRRPTVADRHGRIGHAATATGKGDAARAQADGEANALRAKWEAEATYNANVAASLMPTLIQ